MQNTKNYGLKKPEVTDFYDISVQNDNMDVIDENMGKLKSPVNIGKAEFNGSSNVSLHNIMGRATLLSSGADNWGKYTKFATIDVSSGGYVCCSGLFNVTALEHYQNGQLYFYFRTGGDITSVTIYLRWLDIPKTNVINSVVAVKSSDGVYDLYFKAPETWLRPTFTLIDANEPRLVTLHSSQPYVDSVESVRTSELDTYAFRDSEGNVIADYYAIKKATKLFEGSIEVDFNKATTYGTILTADISSYERIVIEGYLQCPDVNLVSNASFGRNFEVELSVATLCDLEYKSIYVAISNDDYVCIGTAKIRYNYESSGSLDIAFRADSIMTDDAGNYFEELEGTLYVTKVTAY